jgi:hypothetical protein
MHGEGGRGSLDDQEQSEGSPDADRRAYFAFFSKWLAGLPGAERPKCPAPEQTFGAFNLVRRLRLPENLCGFRVLVALGGLYGSACNQACESNKPTAII